MQRFSSAAFLVVFLIGIFVFERDARAEAPTLRIPHVSRAPKLEDFLSGTAREAEGLVTDFRQYEPGDGVPASEETTAYLSYDDNNLYVVFVCMDEPGRIRARMAKREDIESDDRVVVHLDTFHDHRRAYRFSANPLGIQLDSIWTEGQGSDTSFDTLWHSEGRLTGVGFVVRMAIPFKSLRFPGTPTQNWGIALGRTIQHGNEFSTWPYMTQKIEGFVQQFASLEGLERISPSRNMQFTPHAAAGRARFLDRSAPGGPAFRTATEARMGLDTKLVLRDALTLDVALNPDFSQVESDEPQVTINQRFEVFFPEKRPFFIENAGFFQTPIHLFFSRRIADPQFGARLTGKLGRWNLGAIAVDDRAPGQNAPSFGPDQARRAGVGVVRVQREFGDQSSAGVLVTSCDSASGSNRVYSLDTRLKLNPNWVLSGQWAHSDSRQFDGVRQIGPASWAELSRNGRHLAYAARYSERSPEFRSELGFIPRVDVRQMEHFLRYYWRPQNSRLVLFGPDVTATVNWNRKGQAQDWVVDASFGADLRGPTGMGCRRVEAFELFEGRGFRRHYTDCGVNAKWLRWLEILADWGWGVSINYFPSAGQAPSLANGTNGNLSFAFRPSPRFRYEQTYFYTRLGARFSSAGPLAPPGPAMFNSHLLRTKLNYQFTRPLSVRTIVDYSAVLPNPSLVALERTKRLTTDILVTYMLSPGTALYLGFTDSYENLAVSDGEPHTLQRAGAPGTPTGRQFFIKVSYLWRL